MSVLAIGQYFGRTPSRRSAGALTLSVVVHDQQRTNPSHAHEAAFVTLMLDGQYSETAGRRSLPFAPFTAMYHPAALEHQDSIGAPGVRLLMFEFRPELMDGADVDRNRFRSMRDLSGSAAAWELLALHRSNPDPLEFESRALRVVASVAPLAGRVAADRPALERARDFIHAHFTEPLTMSQIAEAAGLHPVYLGQLFQREVGESAGAYTARLRVRAAAERLSHTDTPLAAIAYELGFCDQSHFHRTFKRLSGVTPAAFRNAFRIRRVVQ